MNNIQLQKKDKQKQMIKIFTELALFRVLIQEFTLNHCFSFDFESPKDLSA